MTASSGHPLPKAPAERTFVFAVALLVIVALIQIAAVIVAVAPNVRLDRLVATEQINENQLVATAVEQPVPAEVSAAVAAREDNVNQQINLLLDQADAFWEAGKIEESLQPLMEASRLRPDEPMIWASIARTQRALGRDAQAMAYLHRILADPKVQDPSHPDYEALRQHAQAELVDMGLADPSAVLPEAATRTASATSPAPANTMRDEVGIPIGSVMGIVETRLQDGEPGTKKLRIATKTSASVEVNDPMDVQTMVYFFEQNDHGDIMQTQSTVSPEWLSPPIDWKNSEPELLEVLYPLPEGQGDQPLQYYGYVVGVYFKGELQDVRAEPPSLAEQFPLKFQLNDEIQ
jgi:Putative Zn-dependent protease, contains TPR repeats